MKEILLPLLLTIWPLMLVAQSDLSVVLRVNDRQVVGVYRDQPLIITLSISNPRASGYEQWNRQGEADIIELGKKKQRGEVTEEQYNNEVQRLRTSRKEVQVYKLGSPSAPAMKQVQFQWIKGNKNLDADIPMKLFSDDLVPDEFILDADAYYLLRWGIDRREMSGLPPGKYQLTVTIDGYHSNTVELEVRPVSIPASILNTEAMQTTLGRFALLYGNTDTAIAHARKILSANSTSVNGLVLSAEAYIQKGNYSAALKQFEAALTSYQKQFPRSPEPPEYLLQMIAWLKEKR